MREVVIPPPGAPPGADPRAALRRIAGATMGTTWSAAYTHPAIEEGEALLAVQGALDGVVAQMSPWERTSDLSRYNRSPAGAWVSLPNDLLQVIDAALQIADATGGAFDPTLGAAIDLWGFGSAPGSGAPPRPAQVAAAAAVSGWSRLERHGSTLLQPGGLRLDLGAIAKGFGVDQAMAALQRLGVCNALVEVGGELKGSGAKPDGSPWWALVERSPWEEEDQDVVVALSGWAIATSADHRRSFVHEGVRYGHTIDPKTQAPRRSSTLSATAVHSQCMVADALATAALLLPIEEALAVGDRCGAALRLVHRGGVSASSVWARWSA